MNAYASLAEAYDRLTLDVAYEEVWAFLEELLHAHGKQPHTILDLACGTGSLSLILARKGYQVIGVDCSEEMLTMAAQKAAALPEQSIFFVHQRMEQLRLPQPVDCVVCCLDSLNYITDPAACQKAIRRAYEATAPGGMFLFDINSEAKLRAMDGQVFLDEDDDVYCVWRAEFDAAARICSYGIDLFCREGQRWRRSFEEHREYAYTADELVQYLRQAGFVDIRLYGDRKLAPPADDEQRIYITACKE